MSFILDALKKSETERQRADAPALYETKKAPPRHRVAPWLIVLAALLIINVVVLSVVLLRGSHGAAPTTDAGTPAAPPPTVPAIASPAATTADSGVANPAAAVSAVPQSPNPGADGAGSSGDAAADTGGAVRGSDDDAPAVDPSAAAAGDQSGRARESGIGSGEVPTYEQAATAPGATLPQLKLDLHAYSAAPGDRFILLNMIRLKEGQTSPQGVLVESITPDGAILSWQGSRFLLERQ